MNVKDTISFLKNAYHADCLSERTIYRWHRDFAKNWRESSSDFYFFGKLKAPLKGINFGSNEEVIAAAERQINSMSKGGFAHVYDEWVRRHKKCIHAKGEYFEKEE